MNEEINGASGGWFRRTVRAIIIGFVIYYLLTLSASCMVKNARVNMEQREAERLAQRQTIQPPVNEADLAIKKGYDWASERDIRDHAVCRERWTDANHDSLVRSGCSKYVTEQNVLKVIPPYPHHSGWDDGTTTAECIAEVHAYWDPVIKDMKEQGEDHLVQSRMSRTVGPALEECENFDKIRIGRVIHEPQARIDEILRRARSGGAITEEDKQTVRNDYPGVFSFPENMYRTQYLNAAEEFFRLAGGRNQVL